jgi:hypothetical protein
VLRKADLFEAQIGGGTAAAGGAAGGAAEAAAAAVASPAEHSRYNLLWRCSLCAPTAPRSPLARALVLSCAHARVSARAAARPQADLSQVGREPAVLAARRAAL